MHVSVFKVKCKNFSAACGCDSLLRTGVAWGWGGGGGGNIS